MPPVADTVALVGDDADWAHDLLVALEREGLQTCRLHDLADAAALVGDGPRVRALLVPARPMSGHELVNLRRCRTRAPATAVVVVAAAPTQPDLKRAFESGATAFLAWPASPEALRQALASGSSPAAPAAGPMRTDAPHPREDQ